MARQKLVHQVAVGAVDLYAVKTPLLGATGGPAEAANEFIDFRFGQGARRVEGFP